MNPVTEARCSICRKPILAGRKPTAKEAAWMRRLEAVLLDAPAGIGLLTIGDKTLHVYDKKAAQIHNITHTEDGSAGWHGLVLGDVCSAVGIEGVSG